MVIEIKVFALRMGCILIYNLSLLFSLRILKLWWTVVSYKDICRVKEVRNWLVYVIWEGKIWYI